MTSIEATRHKDIGKNVKTIARARGVTMRDIAAAIDRTEQSLHARMRGETRFALDDLYVIASLLSCTVADLLSDPSEVLRTSSAWDLVDAA